MNDRTPNSSRDKCLDLYNCVERYYARIPQTEGTTREPNKTRESPSEKSDDPPRTDIIIKPADKGGAIVVMDTADYTEKV